LNIETIVLQYWNWLVLWTSYWFNFI